MSQHIRKIIRGCLAGNARDQELLYHRYAPKMFAVCLQYSGNYEEAKDILQEGFIKVYENLERYRYKGSFEGWIRKIMVNTALERYRDKHYLNKVEDISRSVDPVLVVENDILGQLAAHDLLDFIRELPPKYRMVFNLYAIEGYSHNEISQRLGITEGTSKSNLSRARGILQKMVLHRMNIVRKSNYG